jgi:hypothetical protein
MVRKEDASLPVGSRVSEKEVDLFVWCRVTELAVAAVQHASNRQIQNFMFGLWKVSAESRDSCRVKT